MEKSGKIFFAKGGKILPRKSRKVLDKLICHNIVQGINKEFIFKTNKEKNKYLNLLYKYYLEYKTEIIAYCIMDNHVHLLMYSDNINNISNFMKQVNTIYAMSYNKEHSRVGYVFRDRFKSIPILSKEQLYICIKYIHMNPVKAKIVKEEKDYKYSSYNDYLNKSGFLSQNILNLLQYETNNYINKFTSIPYKDIYDDKINIDMIIKDFIQKEKTNFKEIKSNDLKFKKFLSYITKRNYMYSKEELAKTFEISRATLYRKIKEAQCDNK